jgi:hypothetical protein
LSGAFESFSLALLKPLISKRIVENGRSQELSINEAYTNSSLSGEDTVVGEGSVRRQSLHQQTNPAYLRIPSPHLEDDPTRLQSPSRAREAASRLEDELTVLKAERAASAHDENRKRATSKSKSIRKIQSREEGEDDFDITDPVHEKQSIYRPPEKPNTSIGKMFKKVHESFWLIRYFCYITPPVLVFLIPILLGVFVFQNASIGGVKFDWFFIWIEIWVSNFLKFPNS